LGVAIAKLGVPNDQQTIAGRTVYTWFRRTVDEGTEIKRQLRVIVTGNIVASYDLDGNQLKCAYYARLLQGSLN
jgi:hypothetical protein